MSQALDFYQKALQIILKADPHIASFSEPAVLEETINQAEKSLEVKFPKSYRKFISDLGYLTATETAINHLTFPEIPGIPEGDLEWEDFDSNVVKVTLDYRESGLVKPFLMIYNLNDWKYFLDTSRYDETGECPVVVITGFKFTEADIPKLKIVAPSFGEFFYRMVLWYVDRKEFERQGLSY